MLSYFRQHSLRKYLWLILLFASLLTQTQSLFACDLMGTPSNTSCCCDDSPTHECPMKGSCHDIEANVNAWQVTGCCKTQVQMNIGLQDTGDTDVHHAKQVFSSDVTQLLIVFTTAYQLPVPLFEVSNKVILNSFSPSLASFGRQTYSETRRFRI